MVLDLTWDEETGKSKKRKKMETSPKAQEEADSYQKKMARYAR